MRPLPGDDAPSGRPRTSDPHGPSTFRLPTAPQMAYCLADESAIASSSQTPPPAAHHRSKDHRTGPPVPPDTSELAKPRVPSHRDFERNREAAARPSSSKGPRHVDDDLSRPISPFVRGTDTPSLSQPLTPMLGASGPASALSSVSSRRNSLCLSEDLASYPPSCPPSMKDDDVAVEDDEEEEQDQLGPGAASGSSMMDSGSAPQLIMPSIKMPSRRPFTDEGKRMGRLKVLVAGDSGVGKTSLIKAIVQSCEHIVHVDPITPSSLLASSVLARSAPSTPGPSGERQKWGRRASSRVSAGTTQITEVYASTKPYPEWWSEVDDFRVLQRRKSLGDAVLDRNICFVDTPGYGNGSSSMDTITPVTQYIEGHLQRMSSNFLSDGDILNLLGGEGGIQVDAVFYLVSNRLRPVDIEYLRQLSPLTNIIILLAQTDLMSAEQVAASKAQIHSQLNEASIRLFSFTTPSPYQDSDTKRDVYAISAAAGADHDTMDASLLMSPDYVQPLLPTELASLVSHVFTSTGVAWLRHSAARKYLAWRNTHSASSPSSSSPNLPPPLPRSQTLPPHLTPSFPQPQLQHQNLLSLLSSSSSPAENYALARLADHTQREERLAQVRLANWAADLQRSLAKEREQFAALARGERALWLAERIGECVREGSLVVAEGLRAANTTTPEVGGVVASVSGGRREVRGRGASASAEGWRTRTRLAQQQSQQYAAKHHHRRSQQRQRECAAAAAAAAQQHRQDPLGLLEVADELRRKGLVALEVLGSLGVLGGLALWVTRHYLHVHELPYGWVVGEWERFWYGGR